MPRGIHALAIDAARAGESGVTTPTQLFPRMLMKKTYFRRGRRSAARRRSLALPAGSASPEHRHRQRQAGAEGARRCADQAGAGAGRGAEPAAAARHRRARPRQGRDGRDLHAGSREARPRGVGRLQAADGAGTPGRADPAADAGLREEEHRHRCRGQGRVRQVQGPVGRHRIPCAPHPGREGRRGQGADRADQGRRELRRTREEELEGPGIGRQRRRPRLRGSPARTCPSSRRRWSS